jgi:heat shock protein HslJ
MFRPKRTGSLGTTLVLAALVAVGAVGAAPQSSAASLPRPIQGKTFVSTKVAGPAIPGGKQVRISFIDVNNISAGLGCNTHSGKAKFDGNRLTFTELSSTELACDPTLTRADAWLIAFLLSGPKWTFSSGRLTLSNQKQTLTLVDDRILNPDRPLVGTTWRLKSITTDRGSEFSVVIDNAAAELRLASDGSVTGSTGCNAFGGKATVAQQTISFGTSVATNQTSTGWQTCQSEEANRLEQHILKVLQGTVKYEIKSNQLRITRTDGTALSYAYLQK